MAIDFNAETAYMLEDTGVEVRLGSDSTYGQIDLADEVMFAEAGIIGVKRTLLVKTGTLSGIAMGATIRVDGTNYKIVDHHRMDDGGVTRVLLADV